MFEAIFFIRCKRGVWVSVFASKSLVICLADSSTLYGNNVRYRQCTYKHNIETRSHNHCCHGKAVSRPITYSESKSVAVVSQHAMLVRRVTLSPMACLTLPHFFPHIISYGATFGENFLNIKYVFLFSVQF